MSSDEDDYLSNKFLPDENAIPSKHTTYSQLRKAAQKKAQLKNEQNKIKSRRQREIESREEGLNKSLFERAKEEEQAGMSSSGNKALSIMMKMGFKPGQALGNNDHLTNDSLLTSSALDSPLENDAEGDPPQEKSDTPTVRETPSVMNIHTKHKTEPLPLNEWTGRSYFFYSFAYASDAFYTRETGHRARQASAIAQRSRKTS